MLGSSSDAPAVRRERRWMKVGRGEDALANFGSGRPRREANSAQGAKLESLSLADFSIGDEGLWMESKLSNGLCSSKGGTGHAE